MKTARVVLCLFLISQLLFGPCLQAETLPYRLVDTEKYDLFEEDRKAAEEKELIIEDAPDDAQLLRYTNEFWRQAVTAVEGSYVLDDEPEPIPDLTLLNPTLSLPLYGTNLALTGRYVIGFKLDGMRYTQDTNNDIEDRNVHSFEMQQEMQLKMQAGKPENWCNRPNSATLIFLCRRRNLSLTKNSFLGPKCICSTKIWI